MYPVTVLLEQQFSITLVSISSERCAHVLNFSIPSSVKKVVGFPPIVFSKKEAITIVVSLL